MTLLREEIIIEKIQVLSLKPGDVIILKVPESLSGDGMERLAEQWKRFADFTGIGDYPMIIIEDIDVSIIRKE